MELMKFICSDSPYVWNQDGVSECFDNLILGFGVNTLTIALVFVLWIHNGCSKERRMANHSSKVLLILALFGVFVAIFDMLMLMHKNLYGQSVHVHEWLNSCSQFSIWVTLSILLRTATWFEVLSNIILCCWWILRLLVLVPRLKILSASTEVVIWTIEISSAVSNLMFGLVMCIKLKKKVSYGKSSIMEPLLPYQRANKCGHFRNLEIVNKIFHMMTFKVIDPLMKNGVKKQLDFEDLLELTEDMDPSSCHVMILKMWNSQKTDSLIQPSLFKAIYLAYGGQYLLLGILKVFNDCLSFSGPLLLNKLIHFLQEGSGSNHGYILALSLGLVSVIKSFLDTQYSFQLAKLRLKMRSSIMTMIYRKCLFVSLADRSKFSEGEIQTFMSVDTDRIVNLCNSIHDVWSLPLQIGVALFLLYQQVKFAFVSGVAITVLLIPVNKWIANLIAKATKIMMEKKDERIRMTTELLNHIHTLKMYAWELHFAKWLMKTRSSEIDYLSTRKYLDAWCVFFWATTPTLFSLFTFGLHSLMGHQLDAATVFTCLALFNNLISPLNSFPWVINGLIDATISLRRVGNYLSCYENDVTESSSPVTYYENSETTETVVSIRNASCTWASHDKDFNPILKYVNLRVSKGLFVVIVGEVGSGKSSLLNMILGEMRLIHGSIFVNGSKSYVPQVPWIISGTIRDNVLLGNDFESTRYNEALHSCCLNLDISLMVGGDMTFIGEKGVNLSGGQRARLALARAIYNNSDIYLFDDVLSAVDAHVARSILHNAILGPLMNQKTRILCTHNTQAINMANLVVKMDKGTIKYAGKLANHPLTFVNEIVNTFSDSKVDKISNAHFNSNEVQEIVCLVSSSLDTEEIVEAESRKEGKVESTVYKKYATFAGWFITVMICVSAVLMQASRNGNDLWLSFWVDTSRSSQSKYSIFFYLVILGLFCAANAFLTLIRSFSFAFGGLRAAVKVHETLLHNLIDAPVSFFNQTPTGRILNRLSSDLYAIDDSLPFILNILLANFVGLLGIILVLSFVQVMLLLLLIPLWFYYRKLQLYYRSTSRELRRLDSVSRSPIYTSFTETLHGSSTIRAFNSVEKFFSKFMQHVHVYQRTSYSEIIASLWLSLRLQLLAAFIVSFIAVMAIFETHGYVPISLGTSGLVGLALSYASPIVSLLGSLMTSFAETEKEMISFERVVEYMNIPQEELSGENLLNLNWPLKGEIKFHNVILHYKPSSPPSLFDLSFCISGGTRVGIVGRTGAGKSSILNALFRLNPINSGCILIDGLDIARVPVRDLRAKLAIVPQSCFLFEGLLRSNLDPIETSNDMKIWETLERCCIKEEIEAAGGLDIHVKDGGAPFSVGQCQLICLARALLKSSKVLCLDECTANVDAETTWKLEKAIANEEEGRTIITIAHRISTVVSMESILVLDQGMLVEEGDPQLLLQDEYSRFSRLARASTN